MQSTLATPAAAASRSAPVPADPQKADLESRSTGEPFGLRPEAATPFSSAGRSRFRHNYHQHPLLQIDALQGLAEQLAPQFKCRFMKSGDDPSVPFDHSARPPDGRSIADVFASLDQTGSWIALYDVQLVPAYKALVDQVLAGAGHLIAPGEKVFDVRGFIFLSAPPSVTPFHIDGENNFWMQIHGRKTMHLWNRYDTRAVTDADAEEFIVHRNLDNVRLTAATRALAQKFDCGPGDGLYFPSLTPHMTTSTRDWVKPGDGVTVSIGVVFYTSTTRHEAHVAACNRVLRKLGLAPRRAGLSRVMDAIKAPIGRLIIALMQRANGYQLNDSFLPPDR